MKPSGCTCFEVRVSGASDPRSSGVSQMMLTSSDAAQVMGVITRKDIAEANAKLALGRKANLGLTTPSERLVRRGSLPFIPYGAYDPTVGYSSSRCAERRHCRVTLHIWGPGRVLIASAGC